MARLELTVNESVILDVLNLNPATFDSVQKELGIRPAELNASLQELKNWGLVSTRGRDWIVTRKGKQHLRGET